MVCVPCFIIPVVLFFWRWLIQPYFVKYIWNPWEKKDKDGNVIKNEDPEFIQKCENGKCTFMRKPAAVEMNASQEEVTGHEAKKAD